jgi:phosphonate metabolism protein PhnN/1,5-bisphosphokinase (PRPP-forming)
VTTGRGTLILVVGPSGAGKDSLIAGAAQRLGSDPALVFARRVITRPSGSGGEDHFAVTATEFDRLGREGGLMLRWHAHGLDYGLPRELAAALEAGRTVVANVSRTVIAEARRRFAPVAVIAVSVAPETLAARLAARGRETATDVAERLRRGGLLSAEPADFVIDNDGTFETAIDRFVELLSRYRCRPGESRNPSPDLPNG